MLDQYDKVLAERRRGCDGERKKYFRPDFDTAEAYAKSVVRYRKDLRVLLGWPLHGPKQIGRGKVSLELIKTDESARIYRFRLPALGALQLYGILLLPLGHPPYQFVICQHGGRGTPEMVAGLGDTFNYNKMGRRLVDAGYAVVVPQLFYTWGEEWGSTRDQLKMDSDLKQVGSSLQALHVHMLGRVTDWILGRKDAMGKSIGFFGLSYGGLSALLFSAIDRRVGAVVSSCYINNRYRYNAADRSWFDSASRFLDEEVCGLICPRPLYLEFGKSDSLFAPEGARLAVKKIRRTYEKVGLSNRFESLEFDGTHEFSSQNASLNFLKAHLPS